MNEPNIGKPLAFGDRLVLETDLVVAEMELSPREMEEARSHGRVEFTGRPGRGAALVVGGIIVAEGKIVRRGGRHFLKVKRLFSEGREEGAR